MTTLNTTAPTATPLAQRKVAEFAGQAPKLSLRARKMFTVFSHLSFDELLGVQRVYIDDYKRWKAEGDDVMAAITLDQVNALGEVIDLMDGTTRIE